MLYISRWKALAILATTLVICLFAVPNLLSHKHRAELAEMGAAPRGARARPAGRFASPARSRHRRRPQGEGRAAARRGAQGRCARRKRRTGAARRWCAATASRCASAKATCSNGLTKLRELSQPLGGLLSATGQRTVDINNVGGGLVRLTWTEPAILERVRQAVDQSIQIVTRRIDELGTVEPVIQRQGVDRILIQVPGLGDPKRLDRTSRQDRQARIPDGRSDHVGRSRRSRRVRRRNRKSSTAPRPKAGRPI